MNKTNKEAHHLVVQVYYEDTDHSGVVYHPNYLKYFDRAREQIIGIDNLACRWNEQGAGFAVYKVSISYHDGAVFGDKLDIKTTWEKEGDYRVIFRQEAWRPDGTKPAVSCTIDVVWLGPNKNLMTIPDFDFLR